VNNNECPSEDSKERTPLTGSGFQTKKGETETKKHEMSQCCMHTAILKGGPNNLIGGIAPEKIEKRGN